MSGVELEEIHLLRLRVSRLEAQVDQLYKYLGITFSEDGGRAEDPRIIAALKKRKIIDAIKYYRENTGAGLAEAKSAVEAIQARLGL